MTREPMENPLVRRAGSRRRRRPGRSRRARHPRRAGGRDPGVGGADLRPQRARDRRGDGVPRRDQGAPPEARAVLSGEPRRADRPDQPPRVREPPARGAAERAARRGLATRCSTSTSTSSRWSTTPAATRPATSCCARSPRCCRPRVRAARHLARLGGDEFGVLLEGCTLEQATRIAEGVRQAIRDFRFIWGGSTLRSGASIGIVQITRRDRDASPASCPPPTPPATWPRTRAATASTSTESDDGVSHRHGEMQWVARITRAAEDNRFELFFQPIVPLRRRRGRRSFHELLLRLREDERRAGAARRNSSRPPSATT